MPAGVSQPGVEEPDQGNGQYLNPGKLSLPHLEVYGASGKPILERSGDPQALVELVEEAIGGSERR